MAPTHAIHILHRQSQSTSRPISEKARMTKVSRYESLPQCTRLNRNELKRLSMHSRNNKISPVNDQNRIQSVEITPEKSRQISNESNSDVLDTSVVQVHDKPNVSSSTPSIMNDTLKNESSFNIRSKDQSFSSGQFDRRILLEDQTGNPSKNQNTEREEQYFTNREKNNRYSNSKRRNNRQKYWRFACCQCTLLHLICCILWCILSAAMIAAILVGFLSPRSSTTTATPRAESFITTVSTNASTNTNATLTITSSTVMTTTPNLSTISITASTTETTSSTFSTTETTSTLTLSSASSANSTTIFTTSVVSITTSTISVTLASISFTSTALSTTASTSSTSTTTSTSSTSTATLTIPSTTTSTSSTSTATLTIPSTTTSTSSTSTATLTIPSTTTSTSSTSATTSTSSTSTTTSTTTSTATGICSQPCLNGGVCVLPNNTCQCDEDVWIGSQCQTPVRILWKFDNDLLDFYGNFPGTPVNNPSYRSPGIDGHGSCLYLNGSRNQSVIIPTPPFLNMAYTSFSLSAWVRPNTLRANCTGPCCDNAVFGQANQNTLRRSLHIIVRDRTMYFGFWRNDTEGIQSLQTNAWHHMVYVYDYAAFTQSVYLNGVLDNMGTLRGPYQGLNGSLTIGTNAVCPQANHWDGCMDLITYFPRAKSAAEILRDATLTVSYTFNNTLTDDGPLSINGTSTNIQYTSSGRVGSALNLSVNPSFVQASRLVYLGTDAHPYSITLWIQPTIVTRGTIVHVSPSSGANVWSMPMIGFSNTSRLIAQACSTTGTVSLTGPLIATGVWTHVTVTYAANDRFRLWVNGSQVNASSSSFISSTMDAAVTITLGSSRVNASGSCAATTIAMGQYNGLMDEFQLYSRALNPSEIITLATP